MLQVSHTIKPQRTSSELRRKKKICRAARFIDTPKREQKMRLTCVWKFRSRC